MNEIELAYFTIIAIFCFWGIIWILIFLWKSKKIKERITLKNYTGILGLFLLILGFSIDLIYYNPEYWNDTAYIFYVAGEVLLIIWLIWSIINIIRKKESIKENIAIFGIVFALFFSIFVISQNLSVFIISSIGQFFFPPALVLGIIYRDLLRGEDGVKSKKQTIEIEKTKTYKCKYCGAKLPDDLIQDLINGNIINCVYCGQENSQ